MIAVLLNDGQTFTNADGVKIIDIPPEYQGDEIDAAIADGNYLTIVELKEARA